MPTGHMVCDYIAAAMPGADISWKPVIPQNFDNIFDAMNTLFQVRCSHQSRVDAIPALDQHSACSMCSLTHAQPVS